MIWKVKTSIPNFHIFLAANEFGYDKENGPHKWGGVCKTGRRQSPVDFRSYEIEIAPLDPLEFINYDLDGTIDLKNNGHTGELLIFILQRFF